MLENIPEDFEFVCYIDGTRAKISEIDEITFTSSGRPIFITQVGLDDVIFREKVGSLGDEYQSGTEEFDQLVFECYLRTVLK